MTKNTTTTLMDTGVLLALVAISIAVWYYPWLTLLVLALLLLAGCLFSA